MVDASDTTLRQLVCWVTPLPYMENMLIVSKKPTTVSTASTCCVRVTGRLVHLTHTHTLKPGPQDAIHMHTLGKAAVST